jgi:phage-related protein
MELASLKFWAQPDRCIIENIYNQMVVHNGKMEQLQATLDILKNQLDMEDEVDKEIKEDNYKPLSFDDINNINITFKHNSQPLPRMSNEDINNYLPHKE